MANLLPFKVLLDEFAVAGADLAQYTAVTVNPTTRVATYGAAGSRATGFVLHNAKAGEQVQVVVDGVVPAKIAVHTAVTPGVPLFVNASGQLVPAGTASGGHKIVAYSKGTAGASGDIIQVRVSDLIVGEKA